MLSPLVASSTFDPRRIPTCAGWFDGADSASMATGNTGTGAVAANNDAVGYWKNKATSNNATQSTQGSKPLYKTNVRNGLPALYFDGANSFFSLASSLQPDANGSMTLLVACKRDSVAAGNGTLLTERVSARVATFQFYQDTIDKKHYVSSDGQNVTSNATISSADAGITSSWCVATFKHVVGSRMTLAINRSDRTVLTGTQSNLNGAAGARIGRRESSVTQYWLGHIGEMLVYSSDIGSTAITIAEQYLSAKWGIT